MAKKGHLGTPDDTTTAAQLVGNFKSAGLAKRKVHQAIFDATLKEIFLSYGVQLREPIAEASKHTVVYGGIFQGEEVAIKILTLAVDDMRDAVSEYGTFKVECEKTMLLSRRSPSILEVLDYGDIDVPKNLPEDLMQFFPLEVVPFMIIERAAFGSLDKVVRRVSALPGFTRIGLWRGLADATDGIREAHKFEVAHRDIKPQNVLIFGPEKAKIADFGIARWRSRRDKQEDNAFLTPKYCSPEQAYFVMTGKAAHTIGIAGDVYSWAIMVYELVTGKHPFAKHIDRSRKTIENQKAILRAIATNDRSGFQPIGDITFDAMMEMCTNDLKHRTFDIDIANQKFREFIDRQASYQQ